MRLILLDDHYLFGQSLYSLLIQMKGVQQINVFRRASEVLGYLTENEADVVISDLQMPEMNGLELTAKLHEQYPQIRVLILTIDDEPYKIRQAVAAGASGYLLKDTDKAELEEAIQKLYQGLPYYSEKVLKLITSEKNHNGLPGNELSQLSNREIDVLKLIAQEYSTNEIAEKLFVSVNTIESHRKSLIKKLDAKNVVGLIKFAMRYKLVD
ncbi:response regulator transcription factor [Emticicia sp. C21]|uniref:response regulator n=1 Tax=Emticicia sp. C21 TaxID=2302915 RepID=UPI000E3491B5|nr:response regulator transcription factor [Emticicia sp. C21]RFS18548.1 DNA-binding response regulator [Emticicia sp. C21]